MSVCLLLAGLLPSCNRSGTADGAPASPAEAPFFIVGGFSRGAGPDGNTVIYKAQGGLLVVDTGRHPGHSAEILAYAEAQGLPITTIVNTHWHLDHSTGNADIKAVYPEAKLYTTRAVEGALDGFLANGVKQGEELLKGDDLTDAQRAEIERGMKTVRDRVGLLPDVAVEATMTLPVNGRALELNLTDYAVTESDIWIWDATTKTAVVGDLITLPAPFLDTACPAGWRKALADVSAKPFEKVIPGHGVAMTRAEFDAYRTAFDNLLACAADGAAIDCAARWSADAGSLIPEADKDFAPRFIDYYVDNILRSEAKRAEFCGTEG
jgi:glyoxylase-like metal-dependent hydrolase (beta-lactamase superfamily II)